MSHPSLFDPPTGKDFPDRRLGRPFKTLRGPTASALLGPATTSDVAPPNCDNAAAQEMKAQAWQRRLERVGIDLGSPPGCSHGFAPVHPDGVRRCSWCAETVTR